MNYAIVLRLLSYILYCEAALLLLPAMASLIYGEWMVLGVFLLTAAADPVGEAAPEQDAPGQVLHGGQDAGTGGGEAGNGLKHGIHRVGNAAREHKGHRAHHTDEQPAERPPPQKALP